MPRMLQVSAIAAPRLTRHNRFISVRASVLVLMLTALVISAAAQGRKRGLPGTTIVPASNQAEIEDIGIRAHTNLRLVMPPVADPSEAPPYFGYGFETPASLACIYRVVAPIRGCNPNKTTRTPNGGGQSIAIVDAFDDPDAASDLAHFSEQFGLPFDPKKFKVVYASGTRPDIDPTGGWEIEASVDIEYAHAMAPNAMLYLVEAKTNLDTDLYAAVRVAANLIRCGRTSTCPAGSQGKGEISMSWGTTEFSDETKIDSLFTAQNVVYLAATGDSAGVTYPSASPNVIGVGGTTTARSLYTGDLIQEITWSDTGGGLSFYEPTPSYQSAISSIAHGARALPDISADANPNNAYWVYSSATVDGFASPSNWWLVGGTSAPTPLVAGIINAASTASGHFATSTKDELTRIYSQYANHQAYENFWDITYGACNYYSGSFSVGGYDLCTGIGSPKGLQGK